MSATEQTINEIQESLTGFDEIAIEQQFGFDVGTLATTKELTFLRALVFCHLRHGGMSDSDAKHAALSMTIKAAKDYFADEPDELVPDDPQTPVGLDSSAPASEPSI